MDAICQLLQKKVTCRKNTEKHILDIPAAETHMVQRKHYVTFSLSCPEKEEIKYEFYANRVRAFAVILFLFLFVIHSAK